jgi:tetratricopeptide (TPR) repeat protein
LEHALALEPENVQALSTLANISSTYDVDIDAAVALADRALARDPSHVQAMVERAFVLALRTDRKSHGMAQALQHLETARRLDPLNAWAGALHALSLACVGRLDDALPLARESVELDHNAFTGRWALVWILSALGRGDEALSIAMETLPMSGRNPRILLEMAAIYARRGQREAAARILEELQGRASTGYVELTVLGAVHAALGSMDEARALLARGIEEHEVGWQFARSPAWEAMRSDPEGNAMLRAFGYA